MDEQKICIPECFTYEFFEANRYTISEEGSYEALCNNGFIKLYTRKGRVYWHAQNELMHLVPDWKFHVSVRHQHVKRAWNLLVGLFLQMNCRSGMKVIYLREASNPQPGREITIYIAKMSKNLRESDLGKEYELSLSEEHSEQFWVQMVRNIEQILTSYDIIPNGLANGDLTIGKYVSLRNQAFVVNEKGQHVYPPNSAKWNPLGQQLPFNMANFKQFDAKQKQNKKGSMLKIVPSLALPVMVVAGFILQAKYFNK